MAKKFTVDTKRAEHVLVKPSDILIPEFTGRWKRDEANINKRKEDILRDGQLQPIGVMKTENGKVQAVFGFTRLHAGLLIEKDDKNFRLACFVMTPEDAKQHALLTIRENVDRTDLSDVDIAHNQHELREKHGMKNREIADVFRCDPAKVTRLAKLLQLSKKVQEAVHDNKLATNAAIEMFELPHEKQDELLSSGITKQSEVIDAVRKIKEPAAQPAVQQGPTQTPVVFDQSQQRVETQAQNAEGQTQTGEQPAALDFGKLGNPEAPAKPNARNRQRTIQQTKDVINRYTGPETNVVLSTFATALMAYITGEISELQLEDYVRKIEGVKTVG